MIDCSVQAENKQVIVKERLRKLGHATLERVSCINDDITTRTTDHICSMIEERYNFFSTASAHYEEAIPHVKEMRSAMAEARACAPVTFFWLSFSPRPVAHLVAHISSILLTRIFFRSPCS